MAGDNAWLEALGVRHPIFAAPMAGGPSTPELVAAVSNAGGLGFLGVGYLSPEETRAAIRRVRALTDAPFGVNVFIPETPGGDVRDAVIAMKIWLREWVNDPAAAAEIDAIDPRFPTSATFEAQMDVILEPTFRAARQKLSWKLERGSHLSVRRLWDWKGVGYRKRDLFEKCSVLETLCTRTQTLIKPFFALPCRCSGPCSAA
ncbi:NAD(P)H-dependent flavin oxidoreductase [Alicyclobacillus acidocaldarius]|uniref:NAD(P)H-dependent flavin oxidoreductase n=1 Tax=Alicyclobacillus acidocaldarius TaxID=405212 RepID=UPI00267C437A